MRNYFNFIVGLSLFVLVGLYVYFFFTAKPIPLDESFPFIILGVCLLLFFIVGIILLKNFFKKTSNSVEDKGALYLFFGLLVAASCYFIAVNIDNGHDAGSGFLTLGIFAVSFVLLLIGSWKVIYSSMLSGIKRPLDK